MDFKLTEIELRVLGVLIEKEITTPDYYPLSLNALQAGCNQKSNREPVMELSEEAVLEVVDSLKEKRLVWQLSVAGARVPKFEHNLRSFFAVDDAATAILCTLMLRGPQTAGEIRTRAERMYAFKSLEEVIQELKKLAEGAPLVQELPRIPGHKENRWIQLLGEQPVVSDESISMTTSYPTASTERKTATEQRIETLEQQVATLTDELYSLKKAFEDFRMQF
ncbi:MAG TPA: YceH family protein [Chitinispirillaceae bacterium]|nr:YceH family protein [Chitinispirillaceae bacterium]